MAKLLKLRRGSTSDHSSFTGAEGEVTVDTTKDTLVVHDGSTAGGHPLAKASDVVAVIDEDNFSSNTATQAPSQQSTKAYIAATSQPLDADLTSLAGCQSGAAGAIAALLQAEVEILDGATVSTAELNTLDGFTGDKDDLIYAKDLKATGVTATEFDYLDNVTSNIQTQLNAKGVGDVTLAGAQSFTGVKTFNAAAVGEVTALTDGATIATDLALSNNFSVTLGGNRTLGQPTNQAVGQSGSYFITQDGTGSRTLAYHADFKWVGGTAPTLSTAANAVDRIDYVVAAANKIHAVASLDVK